jgi:predicted O-methyltransferase YrrM
MDHFHYKLPGWFTYPKLYSYIANLYKTGRFVEVGSFQGNSAAYMAVEIINAGSEVKLDCIDVWNEFTIGGLHLKNPELYPVDLVYQLFVKNIEPVNHIVTPYRMDSVKAASLYPDNSLEFVFIDANHEYEAVKADLQAWLPKVKKGGHIAGHDYISDERVRRAVNEFFTSCSYDEEENCWYYYVK